MMIEGYGSRREKLIFLASIILLGLIILVVYLFCEMVKTFRSATTLEPVHEENYIHLTEKERLEGISALAEGNISYLNVEGVGNEEYL